MQIERFQTGEMLNNTYLNYCPGSKEAIIIDPSYDVSELLARVKELGLKVRFVINTHTHFDHIIGNNAVLCTTGAKLAVSEIEAQCLLDPYQNYSAMLMHKIISKPADIFLKVGDNIIIESYLGPITFEVLLTPGHSPGSICLKFHRGIFTGDVLFAGSIGRCDLPDGNINEMKNSLIKLWNELPDDFEILPGHMQTSKVAEERLSNYLWRHMVF